MNYSTLTVTDLLVENSDDGQFLATHGLPKEHQVQAFEFWKEQCDGENLPDVSKIDPLLIPTIALPWVDLIEVEFNPTRFRIRLWGTGNVAAAGQDYGGTQMEEAGMLDGVRRLKAVVENRKPYFAIIPLDWHSEDYRHTTHYSSLGLPFQNEDGEITRILCLLGFG